MAWVLTLAALGAVHRRLAEAEAKLKAGSEEAARRVATAESAASESRARAEQLAEEVEKLQDAVK